MIPQNPFKWRHFEAEIILLCVLCWLLRTSVLKNGKDLKI
jgi:hypothetical protein